jgi:hypothetical protein
LNGPISEEVYVEQPPGFEDPQFPNHWRIEWRLERGVDG